MELVRIYNAAHEQDALMVKSMLEAEGIRAMIRAETYGHLLGGTFGPCLVGEVRVLVRPEDAGRATGIIAETRSNTSGADGEVG